VCMYVGLLSISYRIMDSLSSVFPKKSFLRYTNSYLLAKAIAKARDFSFRTVKNLLFIMEGNDKGVCEFVVCGRFCTFVFVQ